MLNRTATRRDFGVPARLILLEEDADTFEQAVVDLKDELRAVRNVLVGILVAVTTASLLLAINIIIGAV